MKVLKIIALTLMALVLTPLTHAQAQPDLRSKLSSATLAVYQGKLGCGYTSVDSWFGPVQVWGCQFKPRFTCTATIVAHVDDVYEGLTLHGALF